MSTSEPLQPQEPQLVEVEAATTAVMREVVASADLASFFDRSFSGLVEVLASQGVAIAGPAFARYHSPVADTVDVEVGFPIEGTVQPAGGVVPGALPGARVARVVHAGSYDGLGAAWDRLRSWISEHGLEPGNDLWEVYVTEPSPEMDPADLRTALHWVVPA